MSWQNIKSSVKSSGQGKKPRGPTKRAIVINRDSMSDSAANAVEQMMESAFDSDREYPRRNEFRVSSFPYCPILDFMNYTESDTEQTDYGTDFYMGVGTAVHENIQYHKPISKYGSYIIGCWKCSLCKKEWGTDFPGTKPTVEEQQEACPKKKCTGELHYEEISFNYKGLSGHLDNLSLLPLKNNPVCAWEYKTCGNKYVDDPYYRNFLPFDKHPHQIETYCALLWILYRIRVKYYALVYVARDKPYYNDQLHCSIVLRKVDKKKIKYRIRSIEQSIKGREAVEQFEAGDEKAVNKILQHKPCQTPQDYLDNGMDDKFFGKEQCPFYQSGECFSSKRMKKILRKRLRSWSNPKQTKQIENKSKTGKKKGEK